MLLFISVIALFASSYASHSHKHSASESSDKSDEPKSECINCFEGKKPKDDDKFGACCFGDRSLGEDFTEANCAFVWAGVGTSSDDCSSRKPCCINGKCSHEHCFDCVKKGGKQIKFCSECHATTTTHAPHTHSTKESTHKTHETTHKTRKHSTGCCCTTQREPRQASAEECHEIGGFYRGDGSSCNDQDACQARCCDPVSRVCSECDDFAQWDSPNFVGFGREACCENVCGVTCCINAKAVNAESAHSCTRQGGTVLPNVAVEDAFCGGGCCNNLKFSITTQAACESEVNSFYLGDGVGFSPGICGGCGCSPVGFQIITESDCASSPDCVYQGNDTQCPSPAPPPEPISSPVKRNGNDEKLERSSSSSSSDSWFSDASDKPRDRSNFTDVCSNDGCCCYKDEYGHTTKRVVRDSLACYQLGGVFQGEGVSCEICSCKGGVCCDGFAGVAVNSQAECELKGGAYAGDGTRLEMEGVCDHQSGACFCDPHPHQRDRRSSSSSDKSSSSKSHKNVKRGGDGYDGLQCLEVPNATVCEEFGCGNTFQGVGTRCPSWNSAPPPPWVKTEGACCVPRVFNQDEHLCEIVNDRERCQFLGGVWNGAGSKCDDETCATITGRCCTRDGRGDKSLCTDGSTAAECHSANGHWGGPDSLCSDEYACDPKHSGACCRKGCSCTVTTPKVCHHVGGRFQGFESKCQDLDNGICKVCMPCEIEAPRCSDAHPCKNPAATCVREYGKCMVLATPIHTDNDYEVSYFASSSDSDKSSSSSSETDNKHVKRAPQPLPPPPHSSDSEKSSHKKLTSNVGPLSCGDESTHGLPCMAKPILGKCRIGICSAPPKDSTFSSSCKSVCWHIRDFECGCECDGAWLKTCAAISGRVVHDKDKNNKYNESHDGLLGGATVRIAIAHDGKWHFVSQQTTSNTGHYAFSGLEPGKYQVSARFPGCFASDRSHRTVDVECLEMGNNSLRARSHGLEIAHVHSHSAGLERRDEATHLADNIDIFAIEDCHRSDSDEHKKSKEKHHEHVDKREALIVRDEEDEQEQQHSPQSSQHHHHHQQHHSDDSDGLSGWGIALIVVLAVLFCCCMVGLCWCLGSRRANWPFMTKSAPMGGRR